MNETLTNLTPEQIRALSDAALEKHVTACQLVEELTPLVQEYFIVKTKFSDNSLILSLPNGQNFRLSAEEFL